MKVINAKDYLELKLIINYKIQNFKHSTLKAILKYEKTCNRNGTFTFREVSFKEIETEIRLLKLNKVSQYWDMPTKIIKENLDIFSNLICESINNSI